jgi:hypothetical protein
MEPHVVRPELLAETLPLLPEVVGMPGEPASEVG